MAILSVCVPVQDADGGLEQTLRSILEQDTEVEVIVLDNAGGGDAAAVVTSCADARVRLVRNEVPLPVGESWNKAVSLSTRRLVKVVDAGEILLPGALDRQITVMGDNGIAVCCAKFQLLDASGQVLANAVGLPNLLGQRDIRSLMRTIVRRGPAEFGPVAATVFRRADFDRVGGFRGDPDYPVHVDLIARMSAFGSFYGLPETLAAWRDPGVGSLAEEWRMQHRLNAEHPGVVGRGARLAGDLRLARAAADRLRTRIRSARAARR
ncbi:glycosyltransferase family 2 protein [Nocardia huaxiensis]|uniref:Glycosyltransferase n=1 Tax=Nocardia huaxiensis TaxID=2755382 RepID=A0A7D6Z0W4_9NOCA|nr:glycosyltransferase [Nocardia huaxiensis]QLY27704.1 glycosyltransferase [Nocardia huaxiensis]UFS98907.1 glycosyltransferase [Nocardia huaxiensis]